MPAKQWQNEDAKAPLFECPLLRIFVPFRGMPSRSVGFQPILEYLRRLEADATTLPAALPMP